MEAENASDSGRRDAETVLSTLTAPTTAASSTEDILLADALPSPNAGVSSSLDHDISEQQQVPEGSCADGLLPPVGKRRPHSLREARALGSAYSPPKTAAEVLRSISFQPQSFFGLLTPRRFPRFEVSIWSDIGGRKSQEDRHIFCPQLIENRDDAVLFGVFDGTVGDFTSDNVKQLILPHLIGNPSWERVTRLLEVLDKMQARGSKESGNPLPQADTTTTTAATSGDPEQQQAPSRADATSSTASSTSEAEGSADESKVVQMELCQALARAVEWAYLNTDAELLKMCAEAQVNYSSSTSVTLLIVNDYCCVGHLGDSRVALGYESEGNLFAEFLTVDHKPNLPSERSRIVRHGGTVEYLHNHNNKPFIRGGDFTVRKSRGEQPMQLQYSRAFGGKDLKNFGLSSEPDIRVFKLDPSQLVLILASDGIWDVQSAPRAVQIVLLARERGENPAHTLVSMTLHDQHLRKQNADNLTAIVVFLDRGNPEVTSSVSTATTSRAQATEGLSNETSSLPGGGETASEGGAPNEAPHPPPVSIPAASQ